MTCLPNRRTLQRNWGHEEKAWSDLADAALLGMGNWKDYTGQNRMQKESPNRGFGLSKSRRKAREDCSPFALQSWPAACTAATAQIFRKKIASFRSTGGDDLSILHAGTLRRRCPKANGTCLLDDLSVCFRLCFAAAERENWMEGEAARFCFPACQRLADAI